MRRRAAMRILRIKVKPGARKDALEQLADGERRMTGDAAGTSGQTQWGAFVTR